MGKKGKVNDENSVFVGRKPTNNYVLAIMKVLSDNRSCVVKARGRELPRPVKNDG